jgi:hypothetical protein
MDRSRWFWFAIGAAWALVGSSCQTPNSRGFFGYTLGPWHDTGYRTIYVPIFENRAFQSGPLRDLQYDLTKVVHQEIEQTTPWKVVHDRSRADTELLGMIVATPKQVINRNQLNEVREGEIIIRVEVVWRDVRTGEILSRPGVGRGANPAADPSAADPVPRVAVEARGRFVPEVGESLTTAIQRANKQLAVQLVSLMENPW